MDLTSTPWLTLRKRSDGNVTHGMRTLRYAAASAALAAALGFFGGRAVLNGPRFFPSAPRPLAALRPVPVAPVDSAPLSAAATDPAPLGSVARAPEPKPAPVDAASAVPLVPPIELTRFSAAASLYRKGAAAQADAMLAEIQDPLQRTALQWIALKSGPVADPDRLKAFEAAHKNWPGADWIRAVREASLYSRHAGAPEVLAAFADSPPRTPAGVLAMVRADFAVGRKDEAVKRLRALWRERDLDFATEGAVLREFAPLLTRDDHKFRADKLLYAEHWQAATRAAALAGSDEVALAEARYQAARGPLTPKAVAAIPASQQKDPGLLFARVQDARRAGRAVEAASWLAMAPKDAGALIDPDKWWSERRMVARELLDRNDAKLAYAVASGAQTESVPAHVDAAFHAGWIALRFLGDAATAAKHFGEAARVALTPLSVARANYWEGRAAEAMKQGEEARDYYRRAAAYPIAYYGQLAAKKLGDDEIAPRAPGRVVAGDDRFEATRVMELYLQAGLEDCAAPLAYAAAQTWTDEAQLAALGQVIAAHGSPTLGVTYGKLATERGYALDLAAFPTNGLPAFSPLPHSADEATVMAVARQESEFLWRAASGAGAKGLMQILPTTAQYTAKRAGVPFDYQKLVADPAFNLQLGAAYLGQLIEDEGGSKEAAFAAYNAGAGRVAQWMAGYGDPRKGEVDLVDWVERIPFDETRDYVQRVSENLGVYKARLAAAAVSAEAGRSADAGAPRARD